MEPVTHGLTSVALSRAGLQKASPWATGILVVAGYAPDWDWLALLGGPPMLFEYRRALGHSIAGGVALAFAVATLFWLLGRRRAAGPVRFLPALALSTAGVASHILLDLPNRFGIKLAWPWRDRIFSWNILESVDPWPLGFLLLGLLLPALFRMVSEEIGAKAKPTGSRNGALFALVMIVLYFGGRAILHHRAEEMLKARIYQGAAPLSVEAYPSPFTPFVWRGIVETENTVEEFDVPLLPGAYFDVSRGVTHFKPDDSPALEAARKTVTVQRFLRFARFPIARVMRLREGYEVTLRDVRFSGDATNWAGFLASVEMNNSFEVLKEQIISLQTNQLTTRD